MMDVFNVFERERVGWQYSSLPGLTANWCCFGKGQQCFSFRRILLAASLLGILLAFPFPIFAETEDEAMHQHLAMLKEWVQASKSQLRAYEWVETTVVTKDGVEKSRVQKRCFYGPDGQIQKVVLDQSPDREGGFPGILPPGRILHRIEEREKEEDKAYMQSAVELVHSYIPPNNGLIQQSVNAGNMSMSVIEPKRHVRLSFADYLKPGDSLRVDVELPTNRLMGLEVKSYLGDPVDAIDMHGWMSVLQDGTIYIEKEILDASSKQLQVTVGNGNYKRIAP